MHDVVVIGGGISGLTAAWKLMQQGLDVVVLEADVVAGGNIRTIEHAGFHLELGPYSILGGSEFMWRLIEELEIEDRTEVSSAAADNRYIYRDGRLVPLPLGLGSFLGTPLLSLRGKLRLAVEPFIRNGAKPEGTAWEFFVRRFGEEAATYIMGPFVSGIYAGDPRRLGSLAAFPKFHNFERDSGSMIIGAMKYMIAKRRRMRREGLKSRKGLYSFTGGLGSITLELVARLRPRVVTGAAVERIERTHGGYAVWTAADSWDCRMVVCAVPPQIAARALSSLEPAVAQPLNETPMSPVTLVHWSQPAGNSELPVGFGFLMPRIYDLRVLGTIFASQLFNNRTPAGQSLFTSYYGGMLDGPAMDLADDELLKLLLAEHSRIFGIDLAEPTMIRIIRYPSAIPQLTPTHPGRIGFVRDKLKATPGVFMAGNYLTGVGIEHAVQSGYLAAEEVARFIGAGQSGQREAVA